jgi:hypothetical protein
MASTIIINDGPVDPVTFSRYLWEGTYLLCFVIHAQVENDKMWFTGRMLLSTSETVLVSNTVTTENVSHPELRLHGSPKIV